MSSSSCAHTFPETTCAGSIGPQPRARASCRAASCSKTSRLRWPRLSTNRPRCASDACDPCSRRPARHSEPGSTRPAARIAASALTADGVTPAALQRTARRRLTSAHAPSRSTFASSLRTARAALPRGTALLAISDWYDLDRTLDRDLAELGARFDCTALVARDPWYDELPLAGIVRLRGAEGGRLRALRRLARTRRISRDAVRRSAKRRCSRVSSAPTGARRSCTKKTARRRFGGTRSERTR